MKSHSLYPFLLLNLALGLVGCGKSREQAALDRLYPDRQQVARVSGRVTVDGEPGRQLFLRLVPLDAKAPSPIDPTTFSDDQGNFAFSTYLEGDGVPLGEYLLLVEKLQSVGEDVWTGPDGLKNLYNHLEKPVERLSVTNPVTNLKIDLQLASQAAQRPPRYGVTELGDRRGGRRP